MWVSRRHFPHACSGIISLIEAIFGTVRRIGLTGAATDSIVSFLAFGVDGFSSELAVSRAVNCLASAYHPALVQVQPALPGKDFSPVVSVPFTDWSFSFPSFFSRTVLIAVVALPPVPSWAFVHTLKLNNIHVLSTDDGQGAFSSLIGVPPAESRRGYALVRA